MKKMLLFLLTLSCIPSTHTIDIEQPNRWQDAGKLVEDHPYITFFTMLAVVYVVYLLIRTDPDEIEYRRIQEILTRSRFSYVPYRIERSPDFWKKTIKIEG